jgi:hypothetical protein
VFYSSSAYRRWAQGQTLIDAAQNSVEFLTLINMPLVFTTRQDGDAAVYLRAAQ